MLERCSPVDGPLFIYPYSTLILGALGVTGLIGNAGLPEPPKRWCWFHAWQLS